MPEKSGDSSYHVKVKNLSSHETRSPTYLSPFHTSSLIAFTRNAEISRGEGISSKTTVLSQPVTTHESESAVPQLRVDNLALTLGTLFIQSPLTIRRPSSPDVKYLAANKSYTCAQ